MKAILLILIISSIAFSQSLAPVQTFFMQGNNINVSFSTNGIMNYDLISFPSPDAGLVWPVSSLTRKTADFASGIWIGAKVGGELRMAASWYASHYSPGNIPVLGQVPPPSVCSDALWRGYQVNLTDIGLVNGGIRVVMAGGRMYSITYDSWAAWPVNLGAPYAELNGIPGYQAAWDGDRPGIGNGSTARPDVLSYMVYMDYTNCTNNTHLAQISLPGGTIPMGVEIHQLAFMFDQLPLKDMYFLKFRIINKSSSVWDSTYIGYINDVDIGSGSCGAGDDAGGTDSARNVAFIYNADNNDCNYGTNPPTLGNKMLQSPVKFTGNSNDTAHLPYSNMVGYKLLGMTSNVFVIGASTNPCWNDPDSAGGGYNLLKGFDLCGNPKINYVTGLPTKYQYTGNACSRVGWYDSSSQDRRLIQSSGPFTMNSSDTQVFVIGTVISAQGGDNFQNVCTMLSMTDSAWYHYYDDFGDINIIGIQTISTLVPGKFSLSQNYPNPFNPQTGINFDVAKESFVKITVFDVRGKEITKLVSENLKPGTYKTSWNASGFPSGVYFYMMEIRQAGSSTGDFRSTMKMVLIK
ncbi:MAG: T9SS type A sorting domain-containing protein [Ignavibacteria bacterium]|nr:T9SS type A sorting domain-containing protein [Ignavibacteria bacterium]MCC7159001.1 T9SS type A sorting domain-containing protein [Ignavibacteria bacterium]